MNDSANQLVRSLFQRDNTDEVSTEELERASGQYPYFGAFNFLLAKKLQDKDPEQFRKNLQRTALLFPDAAWLQHLILENGVATVDLPESSASLQPAEQITQLTPQPEPEQEAAPTAALQDEAVPVKLPSLTIEPVDLNAPLVFEPYHTVDYFASQGIKMKEEEKPADKFGQQLKSFTDWLKTIRNTPSPEKTVQTPVQAEAQVEKMAEHSLENREVITEAMAEVWEKQGNTAKAIEVYRKLSLLEPAKSTYFAAKIEDLKKLN